MDRKKSWKTTLGGILAALGMVMSSELMAGVLPAPLPQIGSIIGAVGLVLGGKAAVDGSTVKPEAIKPEEPKKE